MTPPPNDSFFVRFQQTGQFLWLRFVKRLHKSRDPLDEGDEIAFRLVGEAIKELKAIDAEKRITAAAAIIVGILFQFSLTGDEEHDGL